MSMRLRGAGGEFTWNNEGWRRVLALAYTYGWEPRGTIESMGHPDPDWKGTYFSNDYQLVSTEDAAQLAAALERALPDIFPFPQAESAAPPRAVPQSDIHAHDLASIDSDYERGALLAWASSNMKPYIQEFIEFCKAGPFRIG